MTKVHSFAQLVKKPTRKNAILDKCFLNCKLFYQNADILPQFGKSDLYAFICKPKHTIKYDKGHTRMEKKRIMGPKRKIAFCARYFSGRLVSPCTKWIPAKYNSPSSIQ